jgi:transcriptional regulator with XRE-family HTH domain
MEIRAELVIDAPAEDAWVVVGERFGQISEWASAITESVLDGPPAVGRVRTCQVAGFGPIAAGVIKERLIRFDPDARSLSYEASAGMPRFIVAAVSHWSVQAVPGSACTIQIHATLTLRPTARLLSPALRWRMRADTRRVLAELKHRVETGHPDLSKPPTHASEQVPLCGKLGPGAGVSSQDLDRPEVLYHALMPADPPGVSPFGHHVRRWRAIRRMSQLDLAAAAGTTPRHLSFVETGRSRPGKDLILRIAEALTVPLPERNTLLAAAGLAPAFPAHELGSHVLEPVNRVLEKVLRGHEPYPAWVIRAPLTIVRANTGAEGLFPGLTKLTPDQLIDLWYGPGPFRDHVVNWPDVVQAGLAALRHTAASAGDTEAIRLLGRAEAHVRDRPAMPRVDTGSSPVVCPVFDLTGQAVRTISAVMRFDTAVEITTSQLRIELMFPADDAAEAYFRARRLT